MRRYIGVDPGAKFTGIAVLDDTGFLFHGESDNPVQIMQIIGEWVEPYVTRDEDETTIILEDLLGGGSRDTYIVATIKIVGYVYWSCKELGIRVILVPNQARLANVGNVPSDITGKDEIAAAAHALSAREKEL